MFFTLCQVFKVPFLMSKKYEHKIALDDGSVIFFPLYAPLYKLYQVTLAIRKVMDLM